MQGRTAVKRDRGVSLHAIAWMGKDEEEQKRSKIIEAASYHIFCFLPCLLFAHRPPLPLEECRDSLCYFGISRTVSPQAELFLQTLHTAPLSLKGLKTHVYNCSLFLCAVYTQDLCNIHFQQRGFITTKAQCAVCQWQIMSTKQSTLTSLSYTNTTRLNFYCFLQVTISATENCADWRSSSQKTLTLRYAIQHTSVSMIIFTRPVKALWWPKAYPNSGLNLAVHLWQQRILDFTLTTLLYWQS